MRIFGRQIPPQQLDQARQILGRMALPTPRQAEAGQTTGLQIRESHCLAASKASGGGGPFRIPEDKTDIEHEVETFLSFLDQNRLLGQDLRCRKNLKLALHHALESERKSVVDYFRSTEGAQALWKAAAALWSDSVALAKDNAAWSSIVVSRLLVMVLFRAKNPDQAKSLLESYQKRLAPFSKSFRLVWLQLTIDLGQEVLPRGIDLDFCSIISDLWLAMIAEAVIRGVLKPRTVEKLKSEGFKPNRVVSVSIDPNTGQTEIELVSLGKKDSKKKEAAVQAGLRSVLQSSRYLLSHYPDSTLALDAFEVYSYLLPIFRPANGEEEFQAGMKTIFAFLSQPGRTHFSHEEVGAVFFFLRGLDPNSREFGDGLNLLYTMHEKSNRWLICRTDRPATAQTDADDFIDLLEVLPADHPMVQRVAAKMKGLLPNVFAKMALKRMRTMFGRDFNE